LFFPPRGRGACRVGGRRARPRPRGVDNRSGRRRAVDLVLVLPPHTRCLSSNVGPWNRGVVPLLGHKRHDVARVRRAHWAEGNLCGAGHKNLAPLLLKGHPALRRRRHAPVHVYVLKVGRRGLQRPPHARRGGARRNRACTRARRGPAAGTSACQGDSEYQR